MHIRQLVCTDAFAGVERYITYVAVELAARGHRVDVVGGDPERMHAALHPAGVEHRAASTVATVARQAVRGPRPDLVHSHMTAADLAAAITRPVLRRPVVSTLHFAHRRGHSPLTRTVYAGLRPFVSAEVAISEFVARAAGGGAEVIPNGIPAPEVPHGVERRPVVLVAQRLEREKDTATAVQAWAASGLASQGWELHVLGSGAGLDDLVALAASLGVAGTVRFEGAVADVPDRMARASVFLATALAEPFGFSVVEAMAAGLPVVATSGGAHAETVGPASPDTLFEPGDAAAAGALLAALAADPERRERLGRAGQERFRAELTLERHVDRLEALYRRLVP